MFRSRVAPPRKHLAYWLTNERGPGVVLQITQRVKVLWSPLWLTEGFRPAALTHWYLAISSGLTIFLDSGTCCDLSKPWPTQALAQTLQRYRELNRSPWAHTGFLPKYKFSTCSYPSLSVIEALSRPLTSHPDTEGKPSGVRQRRTRI